MKKLYKIFQNPKNLVLGSFIGHFGPSWPTGAFFQKSGFVIFLTLSQLILTHSKSTIETPEKDVKYVQSQ